MLATAMTKTSEPNRRRLASRRRHSKASAQRRPPASHLEVGYSADQPSRRRRFRLLAGRDLIGQAQTGTGKTAAFRSAAAAAGGRGGARYPGAGADADARARDPVAEALPTPSTCPEPASARVRWPADRFAAAAPAAWRAGRGRHARPGPCAARHAPLRPLAHGGARRGRRDVAHGLHRGRRVDSFAGSPASAGADGVVLGTMRARSASHRRAAPATTGGARDRAQA